VKRQEVKKGRHQRQPLYTHVGSRHKISADVPVRKRGTANRRALLAYLHTGEDAILGSPSTRPPFTKRPS